MNQIQSEFSFETALALLESNDRFSVDFDAAWQWLEYSRKNNAKRTLLENFIKGIDYLLIIEGSDNHTGLSVQEQAVASRKEIIKLTTDCFKTFCMMAGTEKGKEVRRYFLECERQLKQTTSDSFLAELIEYRLTAKFEQRFTAIEQRFVAIEQRLERLDIQIELTRKSQIAKQPISNKYLYTLDNQSELAPHLAAIVERSRCVGAVSARDVCQSIHALRTTSAREIRNYFCKLAELDYGICEGSGCKMKFSANHQNRRASTKH